MKKHLLILFLISICFTNCVPSLHPLYTEKDLILDDRILGKWTDSSLKDSWEFKVPLEKGQKVYQLILAQADGKIYEFEARLVKLKDLTFLDFYPVNNSISNTNDFPETFYADHWLPTHSFAKVNLDQEKLEINFFDPDWIEDLIKTRKIRIKHEKVQDTYVLTAPTEDLQEFILKYGRDQKAFLDTEELKRKL